MARILVTGTGAIIGYGVLGALRGAGHYLIGMDIYADAYGRVLADDFVQAIPTAGPGYPAFLEDMLAEKRPDLVLPCIEQDVQAYDGLRPLFAARGIACCLNRSELIACCSDKWIMHQKQLELDLSPIPSRLHGDYAELVSSLGTPFLLKPRKGYAGKGIIEVTSPAVFAFHQDKFGTHFMAQKLVGGRDEEYTVGLFGDGCGGFTAQIQMRRTLSQEGATQRAWIVCDEGLTRRVSAYCAAFRPLGPTNMQFRREGEAWYLLEINPRISSATSLRAAFGYNDAEHAISYYLDNAMPAQPRIRGGRAIRHIADYVEFDDRTYF